MSTPGRITRTRPSLTCTRCRRRKVKCGKQRPSCAQCGRLGVNCVYAMGPLDPPSDAGSASGPESGPEPGPEMQRPPLLGTALQPANLSFSMPPTSTVAPDQDLGMDWTFDAGLDSVYLTGADFPILPGTNGMLLFNHQQGHYANYSPTAPVAAPGPADPTSLFPSPTPTSYGSSSMSVAAESGSQKIWDQASSDTPSSTSSASQASSQRNLSPFWARAGSGKADDSLFQQSQHRRVQLAFNEARWSRLCRVLRELPPRSVCDDLLQSFLLGVRPVICIVHVPTLIRDYEAFWEQDHQNGKVPEPEDAFNQASFFCLLWAVLFCGAVSSSALTIPAEYPSQDPDSCSFTSPASLQSRFIDTFSLSRQTDLPTLNGLVASLLVHNCNFYLDEVLDTPPFISQALLAARTLGLHSEEKLRARGETEGEIARRVWYHLINQEAMSTVCAGCSLSPGGDASAYDTRMPLDISDAELEAGGARRESGSPRAVMEQATSSSMIFNIAAFDTFRVVRSVIQKCYGSQAPTRQDLQDLTTDIVCLFDKLTRSTVKLKARGLPEEGQISNRLFVAHDPAVHSTHNDNPRDETAFNAYARISFAFMKDFVAVQFCASFLVAEDDPDVEASEVCASVFRARRGSKTPAGDLTSQLTRHCMSFLTSYLQLARLPAFSPHRWYFPARLQPLQVCLFIVGFLEQNPATPEAQQLNYLLEEIFEIFLTPDGRAKLPFTGGPDSWNALQRRHQEIKAKFGNAPQPQRNNVLTC